MWAYHNLLTSCLRISCPLKTLLEITLPTRIDSDLGETDFHFLAHVISQFSGLYNKYAYCFLRTLMY